MKHNQLTITHLGVTVPSSTTCAQRVSNIGTKVSSSFDTKISAKMILRLTQEVRLRGHVSWIRQQKTVMEGDKDWSAEVWLCPATEAHVIDLCPLVY